MSDFNLAIETVLDHEGGFVDSKNDPGGPTKYGISLLYLQETKQLKFDSDGDHKITVKDIKSLTRANAKEIYKSEWWDKYDYSRISSQRIATKLFDMAVNMGQKQAVKILQRACNRILQSTRLFLDGVLGPMTIEIINQLNSDKLISILKSECAAYYELLVKNNSVFNEYLAGWLRRAYSG